MKLIEGIFIKGREINDTKWNKKKRETFAFTYIYILEEIYI